MKIGYSFCAVWITFLFLEQISHGQQISPQLLASLNNVTTFEELQQRLSIVPSTGINGQSISHSRSRGGGVGGVSPSIVKSAVSLDSSRRGGTNVGPLGNVPVIENPIQSRDSCKLVSVCVALPVAEHTGVLLFPKCVDLAQCMGGCCDSGNDCHATQMERVRVKYRQYRILGEVNGKPRVELMNEDLVDMTRHKSCGCDQCLPKPTCTDQQELVNCKCQCKNREEKSHCEEEGGNFRWSEEKCECKCSPTSCPGGSFFDRTTCRCEFSRFDDEAYDGRGNDFNERDSTRWSAQTSRERSDESHGWRSQTRTRTTAALRNRNRRRMRRPSP